MDSPYANELKVAIAAVQAASTLSALVLSQAQAQAAQDAQGGPSQQELGTVSKDDLSPVTIADFAIQALLTSTLHAAFPDDKFVGEESAATLRANPALLERVWQALQAIRVDSPSSSAGVTFPDSPECMCEFIDWCGEGLPHTTGRVWVFDPIDGTENFVQGLVYAVNVALLVDSAQTLSVVGCPNMSMDVSYPAGDHSLDPAGEGCILLAVRGHGAWVRKLRGDVDEVEVKQIPRHASTEALEDLRSVSALNTSGLGVVHTEVAVRLGVEFPGCVLLPWVIRWVLLALGVGNATWWVYKSRSRLAKIWDHAGAMLLFEEVGGRISDVDGEPISMVAGRKMTANYGIIAAPAALHEKVLQTVRDVLAKEAPELVAKPA
ncbi:hypothetical protein N0V82_003346 [Gnomoniopsis sp. IMI 355080]|nr:hypothetical protein N0V82_003346 [Gnomoniopsis sp. IMI 355080]